MVREALKLYKASSEGIINLADCFFQMEYLDAIKAVEIYNEALQGGNALRKYLAHLQEMEAVKRVIEFPQLEIPPASFLTTMQEHVNELKQSLNGDTRAVRVLFVFFYISSTIDSCCMCM